MTDLIYHYDGTFDGFLCCIFQSYAKKESPTAIVGVEVALPTLFDTRTIATDKQQALRVYKKLAMVSPQGIKLLQKGFLTILPNKEIHLYHLSVRLVNQGAGCLRNYADPQLLPILQAIGHLDKEAHLLRGFVRFSLLGSVLASEIEPKNRVLPLLRSHFCGRYQNESFFIYDRTHKEALFYADGKSSIVPLDAFQMAAPDEAEAQYRTLWKRFYDTIAIKERENPRCRMHQMPKRYWNTMTEFQPPSHFTAPSALANEPAPCALNETPAPETPPESLPPAPGSTL